MVAQKAASLQHGCPKLHQIHLPSISIPAEVEMELHTKAMSERASASGHTTIMDGGVLLCIVHGSVNLVSPNLSSTE